MKSYFISSDSYNKTNAKVNEIIGDNLNVIKYDLRTSTLEDTINEANYFSLTGEDKYLVVRCDELFKSAKNDDSKKSEKDIKLLEEYFSHPNEKCILIFVVMNNLDKRKKIYKLFSKFCEMIVYPTLNKKELIYECMDMMKKKGYVINYETGNYIIDNSYNNYDIMLSELKKIFALIKPGILIIDDIKDIISKSITNTTYSFIDAIMKKDLKLASSYATNFEKLRIEPSVVLIMLAKEFEVLYMIKCGISLEDIQKLLNKEPWQMKKHLDNSKYFSLDEIKKIIIKLNDYDYKIKSGRLDRAFVIDLLSLELCE